MAYNCGPGSNPFAGPYAAQIVEFSPLAPSKSFADVDTTPPRMPDRLCNPVELSFALQAPQIDLSALFPKPEPVRVWREPKLKLRDPDEVYVPVGYIEYLAGKNRLRYSDDE